MKFIWLLIVTFLFFGNTTQGKILVKVGASQNQPPYVLKDETGIVQNMISYLNKTQDKYYFSLTILPALRLKYEFNNGSIHLILLSNIEWYNKTNSSKSIDLLKVEDKFFALKSDATSQDYFKNITKVPTVVVNGFNYSFLNNQSDQKILEEKYNTKTVLDENAVFLMVKNGRAKIGVVSSSFLDYLSVTQASEYNKLLISKTSDSIYYRHSILNKQAPISIDELNNYLLSLKTSGELEKIFKIYLLP